MSEIRNLTRNGETFYPLTCTDAIVNRDGNYAIDDVPTVGSDNLMKSGGVYNNIGGIDISELNATENPHTPVTYSDLSSALAAIPLQYRKGGMAIKFIRSLDNRYVQYRLKHTSWSTDTAYWENLRYVLNLRTNLFDEQTTNLGWLYTYNGTQVNKSYNSSFGQTAPIKVNEGETISIYNATKNTDLYYLVRLASNDVEDVADGMKVEPALSIYGGSYYEYKVPPRTEYISVAYINNRDLWIYTDLREEVNNLKIGHDELRKETVITNLFDKDSAYYGWYYARQDGVVVKKLNGSFAQTAPIEVSPGDILSIYNTTPNTDNGLLSILASDDIEDVTDVVTLRPIKKIVGSLIRFVVPSNVYYVSVTFLSGRSHLVEVYKNIRIGNYPFVEINALGDSITQGFISSGNFADPTWCQIVENSLGCKINNYGVSATSVCDGSSESFLTRLNRMAETWIDLLVIFGGTNDYGDGRALTLGTINDEPQQGTNFYASFKNLVLTAINKYPMAQILIITPMRRQNGSPNQYGISIEDIVNAEIDVAKYYGVKCFDFYHEGGINPAISSQRTAYTSDGVHPNQVGINRFLAPRFTTEIWGLIMCRG